MNYKEYGSNEYVLVFKDENGGLHNINVIARGFEESIKEAWDYVTMLYNAFGSYKLISVTLVEE